IGRSFTSGQRCNSSANSADSLRISSELRENLGRDRGRLFIGDSMCNKIAPAVAGAIVATTRTLLDLVPQELIIDLVMKRHFMSLHKGSQQTRATVRRSFLQISIASLHIFAEQLCRPRRIPEVVNRRIDVVRQVSLRLPQVLDRCRITIETRLENGMERH